MDAETVDTFIARLQDIAEERRPADIFLSPEGVFLKIRGALVRLEHSYFEGPQDLSEIIQRLLAKAVGEDIAGNREMDAIFETPGRSIAGFRINAFRSMGVLCAVLRVIDREVKGFGSLGTPIRVQKVLEELCRSKDGLILVAGTTGSGKSSTVRAMVEYINEQREAHILCIEDPLEVVLRSKRSLVTQRQLKRDTRGWISALRSALRQSADVIVVGEIRGRRAFEIALEGAQTGHLVLATYHGRDTTDVLRRLLAGFETADLIRVRGQLVRVLRAIVVQQLIPREDGGVGRIPVMEVLRSHPDIERAISEDRLDDIKSILGDNTSNGMETIKGAVERLAMRNVITWETARRLVGR